MLGKCGQHPASAIYAPRYGVPGAIPETLSVAVVALAYKCRGPVASLEPDNGFKLAIMGVVIRAA